MSDLLQQNPLLTLFFVTTLGIALGRIQIMGVQLGVSAVLFVGLLVGSQIPTLEVPSLIPQMGLVVFVYAIGVGNGASFFRSLQQSGRKQIGFIFFFLTVPVLIVAGLTAVFALEPSAAAGMYAGSATNTAAFAGLIDLIGETFGNGTATDATVAVVIGYSLGYPIGVIGRMLPIAIMERMWQIDYRAEAHALRDVYPVGGEIINQVITVSNTAVVDRPLREIQREHEFDVLFGRIWRNNEITFSNGDTLLKQGDIIAIAGEREKANRVVELFGEPGPADLLNDQTIYIKRRVFVSNPDVVGKPIAALDLKEQYGGLITRVRRGDTDLLAGRDTVLELGDRVRVLSRRTDMPAIVDLFGDSYAAVSQVNLLSFGLGLTIGLLLGMVTFSLPGGFAFRLGFAGGPLVVALMLGALRRTGPIVWTLPYSTNQTLQQLGLILLLSGIGVRSGTTLGNNFDGGNSLTLILAALIVVVGTMFLSLFVGYKLLKLPFGVVAGMLASQPAVLSYVSDRANNPLPQIGFSMALPIGVIMKVAYAQLLLLLLHRFF